MDSTDILRQIRRIEIRTKGLSNNIFSGEYHSAFKGIGMSFSEVRPYQYGDEVKYIDWNVTARTNEPYVKVFQEERDLNVMLMVDISRSTHFGSKTKLKRELAAEIGAILAFSASSNNDKVGAILFTDKVEKYIPPKKGKKHILHILREIIYLEPENNKTDIGFALKFLNSVQNKKSIVFLLSDFLTDDFSVPLRIARKKHDIIPISIFDKYEVQNSFNGILSIIDPESGNTFLQDNSDSSFRASALDQFNKRNSQNQELFKSNKLDSIVISTDDDHVRILIDFFNQRRV